MMENKNTSFKEKPSHLTVRQDDDATILQVPPYSHSNRTASLTTPPIPGMGLRNDSDYFDKSPNTPNSTKSSSETIESQEKGFERDNQAIQKLARQFTNASNHSLQYLNHYDVPNQTTPSQFSPSYSSSDTANIHNEPKNEIDQDISKNPFIDSSNVILDPHSDEFSPREWAKYMLRVRENDPTTYPSFSAGVAFKDLTAYGYSDGTGYQKTVLNVVYTYLKSVTNKLSNRKGTKTTILRNFNGLVKSGETCVVLGRPGAYVEQFFFSIFFSFLKIFYFLY